MLIKITCLLIALSVCTAFSAVAQEQAASEKTSQDDAFWQKQCSDKADDNKLAETLRLTFMIECVAGARLNTAQKP